MKLINISIIRLILFSTRDFKSLKLRRSPEYNMYVGKKAAAEREQKQKLAISTFRKIPHKLCGCWKFTNLSIFSWMCIFQLWHWLTGVRRCHGVANKKRIGCAELHVDRWIATIGMSTWATHTHTSYDFFCVAKVHSMLCSAYIKY